jgi:AbrB family looped-hinge helix DNA binding protein
MRVTIGSRGRLVLPASLRKLDSIKAGDQFELVRVAAAQYRLTRIGPHRYRGIFDWLLECPEKDWFQSMPRCETTDSIKSPFDQ